MRTEFECVFLKWEPWSEWYTLDFLPPKRGVAPKIIIGIETNTLNQFLTLIRKSIPVLGNYRGALMQSGISADFLTNCNRPWGFGGVLIPYKPQADTYTGYRMFSITIPRIEKDAGTCESCGGSGENNGVDCIHCTGSGKRIVHEWKCIDRIAATLSLLTAVLLDKPSKEVVGNPDTSRKQLLSIVLSFRQDEQYIGATLSREFGDYVRTLSGHALPEVLSATKSAYLRMFPSYKRFMKFVDHSFRAYVADKGQLIIDIPGNACGLYVDGMSDSLKETSGPVELKCHNVDGSPQQLTLLCGLAALAGQARRVLG